MEYPTEYSDFKVPEPIEEVAWVRSYSYSITARCIFAFIFALFLASWNHSLFWVIWFLLAMFVVDLVVWRCQAPYGVEGSALVVIFGIAGWIIGRALVGKDFHFDRNMV